MPSAIVALGGALSLVLALLAGLHAYWALGGRRGLDAALGGHGVPPAAAIWAVAVALALGASVVLGWLRIWNPGLPRGAFGYGIWGLVAAFVLAALVNLAGRTTIERFGFAPLCLALALLLTVVARSIVQP